MRARRAKRIAMGIAALAAAMVIIGGLALRGTIHELWLIRDLSSKEIAVRDAAAQRLMDRRSRLAVPHLFRAFRGTPQFESRVSQLIDTFGPEAAIPALEEVLAQPEVRDRRIAVEALIRLSGAHPAAVPGLCQALGDLDPELRRLVLYTLEGMSPGIHRHLDAHAALGLLGFLKHVDVVDESFQSHVNIAVEILGDLDPARSPPPSALVPLMADDDADVREYAIRLLGKLGPEAREAVPPLIDYLGGPHWKVSAISLAKMGPEVVAPLSRALKDPRTLHGAVFALGLLGSEARDAVPSLCRVARETPGGVWPELAKALSAQGKEAAAAVPLLIEALKREPAPVRRESDFTVEHRLASNASSAAARALVLIGHPAVEPLAEALRGSDPPLAPHLEEVIAYTLSRVRKAAGIRVEPDPALFEDFEMACGLRGSAPTYRCLDAAMAYWRASRDAAPVLPQLIRILRENPGRCWSAAHALGEIGPAAAQAVPALVEALDHPDRSSRMSVCKALGMIGPGAVGATSALASLLSAPVEKHLGESAIRALVDIGSPPAEVVPALVGKLRDFDLARVAAGALGQMGPGASASVPDLVAILSEENHPGGSAFLSAMEALGRIGPGAIAASPALQERIAAYPGDSRSGHEYTIAVEALWRIEGRAELVVGPLIRVLEGRNDFAVALDSSGRVRKRYLSRQRAAVLLGEIGGEAREAVPALHLALEERGDPELRLEAAAALYRIEKRVEEPVRELIEILEDDDSFHPGLGGYPLHEKAARALGETGPRAAPAVPALVEVLRRRDLASAIYRDIALATVLRARPAAAEALGRIGPAARSALPALEEAAADPDPALREKAVEAMARIRG